MYRDGVNEVFGACQCSTEGSLDKQCVRCVGLTAITGVLVTETSYGRVQPAGGTGRCNTMNRYNGTCKFVQGVGTFCDYNPNSVGNCTNHEFELYTFQVDA